MAEKKKKEVNVERELAKDGMRVVKMTDVTITREGLIRAMSENMRTVVPGNEIPKYVDKILQHLILHDQK